MGVVKLNIMGLLVKFNVLTLVGEVKAMNEMC